jgi:hypothetical protein
MSCLIVFWINTAKQVPSSSWLPSWLLPPPSARFDDVGPGIGPILSLSACQPLQGYKNGLTKSLYLLRRSATSFLDSLSSLERACVSCSPLMSSPLYGNRPRIRSTYKIKSHYSLSRWPAPLAPCWFNTSISLNVRSACLISLAASSTIVNFVLSGNNSDSNSASSPGASSERSGRY